MNRPNTINQSARKRRAKLRAGTRTRTKDVFGRPSGLLSNPRQYVLAVIDPFAPEAVGVKLPDFDGNASFTVTSRDDLSISVNAVGAAGALLQFGASGRNQTQSITATATQFTTVGAQNSAWSDYTSGMLASTNSVASRMISGGIRISNILSLAGATAAQGRLIIAPLPNYTVYNTGTFTESSIRKLPGSVVIALAALAASSEPVCCYSRALDPSAYSYVQPGYTLTGTANDDPQFTSFVLMIVGAPANTTPLIVEMVAHWEALPVLAQAALTSPAMRSSQRVMEEAHNISEVMEPIVSHGPHFGPDNRRQSLRKRYQPVGPTLD